MNYKENIERFIEVSTDYVRKEHELKNVKINLFKNAKEKIISYISSSQWVVRQHESTPAGIIFQTEDDTFINFMEEIKYNDALPPNGIFEFSFGKVQYKDIIYIIPNIGGLGELDQYLINVNSESLEVGIRIYEEKITQVQNKIDAIQEGLNESKKTGAHKTSDK